jgi:hypothetical protein
MFASCSKAELVTFILAASAPSETIAASAIANAPAKIAFAFIFDPRVEIALHR